MTIKYFKLKSIPDKLGFYAWLIKKNCGTEMVIPCLVVFILKKSTGCDMQHFGHF